MNFEFAYDLEVAPGNEVVLVQSDDRHRKIRIWVTTAEHGMNQVDFTGNSIGSSVKGIKAAKKDEEPVPVRGSFKLVDGHWRGTVEGA